MTLLTIGNVLGEDQLAAARVMLERVTWKDGKATAGKTARAVKENQQADLTSGAGQQLRERVSDAVFQHPVFAAAARPRRTSPVMISKTSDGEHYGRHVDNAFMGKGETRLRTDLSFTLFLSEPESYDGGELVLHSPMGEQAVKLSAGGLVLYPTSDIHEVKPVTRGERLVAVGWIESSIADASQRALLFDLENLRASLRQTMPGSEELLTLDKTVANLLRMWGQA
ncbi:Fe2+-dependent dioxygenase [Parvularcula sp. ZS-1/3]|uniref:Fe2+-dependent dioxygenase n=1 Tax=Parvularcula mediterranea TaxID=2732508 RepID=A0A7Y3W5W2_9PROT|nr:Fe2+-dependent dioxygenase [Parvularcula mediterranea]NNU17034.1 Fe2+-dependent dioxygenase [Parvularcula mediterranea]